ncbi:BrnA antitoxin family protein [Rubrivivax pictus]|uniref:BrnA antitoxin family protein n=1 Tax=Aquabacterium humicola TaxID=3237377 RepID=UPI0025431F11|nr:BrnA antitoxin family protein [Rubrivivax pictus]
MSSDKKGQPTDEHPEFNPTHVVKGIVRRGLKPVANKELISLRIDQDVIEWFKAQGPGYQTRINSVLRAFRDASAA